MDEIVYSLQKEVTSVDTDYNQEVKLSTLFLYFQEISSLHSEVLGVGKRQTLDKNLHWIISRFIVDIIKMPKYGDKIIVKTYPGKDNQLFFYRHYYITDLKGNVLVRANSIWVVLDAFTHQVVRNPFSGFSLPQHHEEGELDNPPKITEIASNLVYSKKVRYSDIDLNKHFNNVRYIELIQDSFDLDYYKDYKIKNFSINYVQEFVAGDEVNVYISDSNPYIISGKKNDKEHFRAKVEFVKR